MCSFIQRFTVNPAFEIQKVFVKTKYEKFKCPYCARLGHEVWINVNEWRRHFPAFHAAEWGYRDSDMNSSNCQGTAAEKQSNEVTSTGSDQSTPETS